MAIVTQEISIDMNKLLDRLTSLCKERYGERLILEYRTRFSDEVSSQAERLAGISAWLRKEREFSFYGDKDRSEDREK